MANPFKTWAEKTFGTSLQKLAQMKFGISDMEDAFDAAWSEKPAFCEYCSHCIHAETTSEDNSA